MNAIRLREDIAPDALVDLHERIRVGAEDAWIVTVGGAGALRLPGAERFWDHHAFPTRTLPRGIARPPARPPRIRRRQPLELPDPATGIRPHRATQRPLPDHNPNGR